MPAPATRIGSFPRGGLDVDSVNIAFLAADAPICLMIFSHPASDFSSKRLQ